MEDETKARQVHALLPEVERALRASAPPRGRPYELADVACGRGWLGLAAAALLPSRLGRSIRLVGLEADAARADQARAVQARLGVPGTIETCAIALGSLPPDVHLLVALHACGPALDEALEAAIAAKVRRLLLVPCCHRRTGKADAFTLHRGELAARFERDLTDLERALRLEAAGYVVEALAAFPPRVSGMNLLLRGHFDPSTRRMERARERIQAGTRAGYFTWKTPCTTGSP
jgi:hypothetical protein